jgi:hypothetical protein
VRHCISGGAVPIHRLPQSGRPSHAGDDGCCPDHGASVLEAVGRRRDDLRGPWVGLARPFQDARSAPCKGAAGKPRAEALGTGGNPGPNPVGVKRKPAPSLRDSLKEVDQMSRGSRPGLSCLALSGPTAGNSLQDGDLRQSRRAGPTRRRRGHRPLRRSATTPRVLSRYSTVAGSPRGSCLRRQQSPSVGGILARRTRRPGALPGRSCRAAIPPSGRGSRSEARP